jgi:hypothetical protein
MTWIIHPRSSSGSTRELAGVLGEADEDAEVESVGLAGDDVDLLVMLK